MTLLEVDGSVGEGGGQILRTALALAAVTGQAVRVHDVRAGRPNPGLARQHLTAAEALVDLCQGDAEGLALGSTEVTFRPGDLRSGRFEMDVGTAGSVTLITQALLLPALYATGPVQLRIRGGTDVRWSPPADYVDQVFLPLLGRMGPRVAWRVLRRGYYPRGGGAVEVETEPLEALVPLRADEPSEPQAIRGRAHIANLPEDIPRRMRKEALQRLVRYPDVRVEAVTYGPEEAEGRGGALVLWAETAATRLGSSALAEKGVPAEELGRRAAEALGEDLEARATLDVHAADQLLPYLALAQGPSAFRVRRVSGHLETLFWLLPQFVDVAFETREVEGGHRVAVRPSRTSRSAGSPPPGPPGPAG